MTQVCLIHNESLQETHPADVENGPQSSDVYNRLICWKCESDVEEAWLHSECLLHHKAMHECWLCTAAVMAETREEELSL